MAKKRATNATFVVAGQTGAGVNVMLNVYGFFETHGYPLDSLFADMWERQALPDWEDLVRQMTKAGRPLERAFGAIRTAVDDACYPPTVREGIQSRLLLLEERWTGVKGT
jgi:hypothetical protein